MLRELTHADLPTVDSWFAESETRQWLGDPAWPRQLIRLAGLSRDRFAFAAVRQGVVVGIADVERYEDGRAAVAIVVAPEHRRRGVGKTIVMMLIERAEPAGVVEFVGGVEAGNGASAAFLTSCGFEQTTDAPDDEGFTYFALRRSPVRGAARSPR